MQIERRAVCTECNEAAPRVRKGKKFRLCEDCRRTLTIRKWKVRGIKRVLANEIGRVVEFNQGEGWRTGYLLKIIVGDAIIQPVGALGKIPETIQLTLADVKVASCGSPSMPTVDDFYKRMEAMKPKKTVVLVAEPISRKAPDDRGSRLQYSTLPPASAFTNELAEPEVGDVSFPFGANAPVQETAVSMRNEQPKKADKPATLKKPKQDAITVGLKYGPWKALEYTGHSRWKCVSDSGEEKVLYSAELRTAAAAK